MAGSENVFNIIQIGAQSGTAYSPGSAVAATFKLPVEAPVAFELDRASQFAAWDLGRNARNAPGSGFHGLRQASATLPAQVRFEDIAALLEMHCAGGVVASGVGPYTRIYPFEVGTPTLIPATIQGGNTDTSQSQARLVSALIDTLTIGFPDIVVPGAQPWTVSAGIIAVDREISAVTGSLSARTGLETVQGHLTRLYEGTTGTAFAALAELSATLKSFTMTSNRFLALRAYGSADDKAIRFGFKQMSACTFEAKVGISADTKTDFHDVWNSSGGALGERRMRLQAAGSGTKMFTVDFRSGITAVPWDDIDGERVYKVTGEMVDDSTLNGLWQATIVNSVA